MTMAAICMGEAVHISGPEAVPDSAAVKLGGVGGIYLLAPRGKLEVSVFRQETGPSACNYRLILFTPERRVLSDVMMPGLGDGKRGITRMKFAVEVEHPGVYGLCLTSPGDRYGTKSLWWIETNCPRYLYEVSRGHRDRRHEEPIVVRSREREGDILFWPSPNAFSVELSAMLQNDMVEMRDNAGRTMASLTSDGEGKAAATFEADARRTAPWSLHFKHFQGVINLDNLTRWDNHTPFKDLSLFTDKAEAWFDYYTNWKLLTPYSRRMRIPSGQSRDVIFRLENSGAVVKSVSLSLEYPEGGDGFARLERGHLTIKPGETATLRVNCTAGDGRRECLLRVTCGDFSTYSRITVEPGDKEQEYGNFGACVQLSPFRHENERFAYDPDYPTLGQPYFDASNRPFIVQGDVRRYDGGRWQRSTAVDESGAPANFRPYGSKIAFDADGWVYVIARINGVDGLGYSSDGGATFRLAPSGIVGANYDIETFNGHNCPPGPPPLVSYKALGQRNPKYFWRRLHDTKLLIPLKENGRIRLLPTIQISDCSIGLAQHSGIPDTIVSRNGRTHVIWAETTDPEDKSIPGVPTYVTTYDHKTGKLGRRALIGYGPPANDVHNTPSITMDGNGYLHAMVGTHGAVFKYARSLSPDTAEEGWTPTRDLGTNLSQTYIGMVCDNTNTLRVMFRLWRDAKPRFGYKGSYSNVSIMTKPAAGDEWTAPRPVVEAAFTDYSVFYHRLTIDRQGVLYLSYDYWSTYWFYRKDQAGSRRCLIRSLDGGATWSMAPDFK